MKRPLPARLIARTLRRNSTDAEKAMWRELRRVFPQAKFRRQCPIGPYFADFLSFRHKLVIEVDGGQHATQQPEDEARTRYIESQGFRVLRFWNNEVLTNANGVLQSIGPFLSTR
ncbi:DUF559 domain-containing protein [Altererythrobacter sp. KTW20L]|uniref:endonuclease domain-containing protein n=1 Tax=Altererythrobacter sp. KTW20L TaxID=2942210 RepID=UPI0020BFDB99|nr:DUF559 domain-containing protein [Altererythrobacter sp. KTW20L]MCL6250123.1 DUF559 domain-containing protein [Altererythrobacter sp. KTW20L]